MEWQPIETIPVYPFVKENWFQNGPRYLLWTGHVTIGAYGYTKLGKGSWKGWEGKIYPTHWMPLPPPPAEQ